MKPLVQAIEAIRAALKEEAAPSSVQDAAITYAKFCADAERRLDRVDAMLKQGSDYQALQVAEEDPPLLDLAAMVSFGEEKNWQFFCENHSLKVAPRLNAKIVQELENLYAKGISANHPLYKDFRAAMLSRDDGKSLRIIKTILKLNPQDENAKKELLRLENKSLQETVALLREALKTDDEERIAMLTEAIKAIAPEDKLERQEVYQQGEEIRRSLRRRQAQARMPDMLTAMSALKTEGKWRQLSQMLDALQAMLKEHQLTPAGEQRAAIEDLTRYCQQEKSADEKQRNFDRTLKDFLAFAREVETRLLTGAGVTYAEIAEKDESFVKRWTELEGYQLPVNAESLQRLRAAGQGLRARLKRMQRAKSFRSVVLAAAALILLSFISVVGLHAWKAWTLTQELASYQAKESTGAAQDLIKKLQSEEKLLLRWPYLQAKVTEVNSWASQAKGTDQQAKDALQALEQSFHGEITMLPGPQLLRQLDDAGALVKQLAGDLSAEQKNRLTALKTKADLHFANILKNLSARTAATLSQIEKAGADELSYERSAAKVRASGAELDSQLQPLEALLKPEVPALALPPDLETRIHAQRQRLNTCLADLQSFERIRAETAQAGTRDDYKNALSKWQAVKFAEAAPAMKALETLPTELAFQAALYTHGDQEMLQSIIEDKSRRYIAPDTMQEADLKKILSLLHDENLNNIFENGFVHYSGKNHGPIIWSKGRPEQSEVGSLLRWTAKFYQPDPAQMSVMFIKQTFTRIGIGSQFQGDAIVSTRLSPTSEFMNWMEFSRIPDEKGERVMRPLLEVFDKLAQNATGSPIAKAYVMLRLQDMLQSRPRAWGEHYCPSLQQDLLELQRILGPTILRSEDWLVQAMRDKWQAPLEEFFKTCRGHSYMREATARRNYLHAVTAVGIKFAGYVETDLSLVLNQHGRASRELWVVSREDGQPLLVPNPAAGSASSEAAKPITASASIPLSPVFIVNADRKALAQQYHAALSSHGTELKPVIGESVFLTAP